MPRRTNFEQKALQLIVNNGHDGVLQSDLWRKLGASSREGSRVALKLESKGLILRDKELCDGRWTYRLYPKRLPASIDTIVNCPCLMCPDNTRCSSWAPISPQNCEKLTEWLMRISNEQSDSLGDC